MIPPTMGAAMSNTARLGEKIVGELLGQLRAALLTFVGGQFSDVAVRDWMLAIMVAEAVEKRQVVSGLGEVIDDAKTALQRVRDTGFMDDEDQDALEFFIQAHEVQLDELTQREFLELMRSIAPRVEGLQKLLGSVR
jgi:hypothetical protein